MNNKIPNILHYVFGMAADFGGKPWSLMHHVCLKSAITKIKPEEVFLYYAHEPCGPWWDRSREYVSPVKIEAPTEIFGRAVSHVAHRADIVRLQKLIEHGGIYLDADVLVQRNFDDLLDYPAVMGQEKGVVVDGKLGMANAVILAKRGSPFLKRWFDEYRSFDGSLWNDHSVKLPAQLAHSFPNEIHILPPEAFFYPLWTPDHIEWMFCSSTPIPLEATYANHLWEAMSWRYVEGVTPGHIRRGNSNFCRWAAPYVSDLPDDYGAAPLMQRMVKGGTAKLRAARAFAAKLKP